MKFLPHLPADQSNAGRVTPVPHKCSRRRPFARVAGARVEPFEQLQDARRYALLDHVLVHRFERAPDFTAAVPAELGPGNAASFNDTRDLRPYRPDLAHGCSRGCPRSAPSSLARTRRRSELFRIGAHQRTARPAGGRGAAGRASPATKRSSRGTDGGLRLFRPQCRAETHPPVPPAARHKPRPDRLRPGRFLFERSLISSFGSRSGNGARPEPGGRLRVYRSPAIGDRSMLTLDLVDRLLASTLVPRDAKLAAVESWRREL